MGLTALPVLGGATGQAALPVLGGATGLAAQPVLGSYERRVLNAKEKTLAGLVRLKSLTTLVLSLLRGSTGLTALPVLCGAPGMAAQPVLGGSTGLAAQPVVGNTREQGGRGPALIADAAVMVKQLWLPDCLAQWQQLPHDSYVVS